MLLSYRLCTTISSLISDSPSINDCCAHKAEVDMRCQGGCFFYRKGGVVVSHIVLIHCHRWTSMSSMDICATRHLLDRTPKCTQLSHSDGRMYTTGREIDLYDIVYIIYIPEGNPCNLKKQEHKNSKSPSSQKKKN